MRKLVILGFVWAMTAVLPSSRAFAADQGSEGSLRFETTVPFISCVLPAARAAAGRARTSAAIKIVDRIDPSFFIEVLLRPVRGSVA